MYNVLRKVGALIAAVRGTWLAKTNTNTAMSFGEYDLQGNKHFAGFAIRLLESLFSSILLPSQLHYSSSRILTSSSRDYFSSSSENGSIGVRM